MSEYHIVVGPLAAEELNELRAYDHRAIRDAIAVHLVHEPLLPSKHRKHLAPPPAELAPELELVFDGPVPAVWQLRAGPWRVIYLVVEWTVYVVRIVKKGRLTTGRSLS